MKQQEYFKALYGTQATPPRWKTCTMYVNKNMGMSVGALFVREHFNENSKIRVSKSEYEWKYLDHRFTKGRGDDKRHQISIFRTSRSIRLDG